MSIKIPFPLLLVEWKDHFTEDSWTEKDKLSTKPELCLTVGWLVKETDEIMILASGIDPNDPDKGAMGGSWHILKNCITSQKVLRK